MYPSGRKGQLVVLYCGPGSYDYCHRALALFRFFILQMCQVARGDLVTILLIPTRPPGGVEARTVVHPGGVSDGRYHV